MFFKKLKKYKKKIIFNFLANIGQTSGLFPILSKIGTISGTNWSKSAQIGHFGPFLRQNRSFEGQKSTFVFVDGQKWVPRTILL